ncbi:tellurite resistance TerB family protein [Portibacter marinus]|uniref:tellurite resistance TerB family protein n=1 Tax=Portibacter marinus TaxID=2898660 RepID=UPI001F22756E|nr:TerB family tellurite resistance protein [Portibacter marinus]
MKYSYPDVEQYLVDYQIDGKKINCTFQTPNGEIYEASGMISASKTIGNAVQNEVARVVKRNARRQTNRLIRSMLGGTAGRIGSRVARSAIGNIGSSNEENFTTQDKEEAIVKAFGRVSRHFESNRRERVVKERPERGERRERGRSRERSSGRERRSGRRGDERSDSDYEQLIAESPVENGYDQEILSRFLVGIASADGKITPDEREMLADIIPARFGSIQEIQSKDQVSRIEAEEIDENVKETVYLLGWAMALSDFDVDPSEVRILNTYGEIFGLPDHRKEKLEMLAKKYCLEQTITAETSREDLFELADGINLSRDEAERCLINFKKRQYE